MPCLIREDIVLRRGRRQDLHLLLGRLDRWTRQVEAFAGEYQGRPTPAMGRFSGKREWETCYHGWDLADAIKDLDFVRSGRQDAACRSRICASTHKDMWTLDDVRGHTLASRR